MQASFALLDAVFGRRKKGVKYLRRLLIGHKVTPLTYLYGPGAPEFMKWLSVLSAHPAIVNRAGRRESLYGQRLVMRYLPELSPELLEDHLVFGLGGLKQLYICQQQPALLEGVEDAKVAAFKVGYFDFDAVIQEVPMFVRLLLKEVDYQGRPRTNFSLGI